MNCKMFVMMEEEDKSGNKRGVGWLMEQFVWSVVIKDLQGRYTRRYPNLCTSQCFAKKHPSHGFSQKSAFFSQLPAIYQWFMAAAATFWAGEGGGWTFFAFQSHLPNIFAAHCCWLFNVTIFLGNKLCYFNLTSWCRFLVIFITKGTPSPLSVPVKKWKFVPRQLIENYPYLYNLVLLRVGNCFDHSLSRHNYSQ